MFTKKALTVAAIAFSSVLITTSSVMADAVEDVILNVGTTQAFTDEEVSNEDITTGIWSHFL